MIIELEPSRYPWDLLLLADPSRDAISAYIKDAIVLGDITEHSINGVVAISPLSAHSWEIKNIAVALACQGKGIGKTLLQAAINACAARGAHEVWIGTGNSSINQLGLYQKMGFRMVELDRGFFERNYVEDIFENGMQCRDMVRLVYTIPPPSSSP